MRPSVRGPAVISFFALVVLLAVLRCGHGTRPDAAPTVLSTGGPVMGSSGTTGTATSSTGTAPAPPPMPCANGVVPTLGCAALPNPTAIGQWVDSTGTPLSPQPSSGQTQTNAYLDYDLWAWSSFAAMNWPAVVPSSSNGYQRGFPDQTKSFIGAASTDLTVWETFKEKREVFLYDYINKMPSPQTPYPWNSAPKYGPDNAQVPCCPGSSCDSARELGSGSKLFFDTLDETAEVASEARETQAALCAGWVNPSTQCTGQPTDNPCCTLTGKPVGPRVWRGNPFKPQPIIVLTAPATPVVYEVKVNYDSFAYIMANSLYNVTLARTAATAGNIRLPARTSNAAMPPVAKSQGGTKTGPNTGPTNYSAQNCLSDTTGTPCLAGAVHLKAAWLQLGSGDDASKYHTAQALSYRSTAGGGVCKAPSLFGLIGLHIIQRVHQTNSNGTAGGVGPPAGGTYVFATWEHTGNDAAGFTYANYPTSGPQVPYPNVATTSALPLNRVYPILPSTARANALVHQQLGCSGASTDSVWCNYELVGTQYHATQTPSPQPPLLTSLTPQSSNVEMPVNSGQPYYLANLVVESNAGLQQFQGLPPTGDPKVITVIKQYSSHNFKSTFGSAFNHTAQNLAWRTQRGTSNQFNMGGCMGCHGVAQLSGYSFSFVLLDNQYGAIPDSQHSFTIPPTPDPPSN